MKNKLFALLPALLLGLVTLSGCSDKNIDNTEGNVPNTDSTLAEIHIAAASDLTHAFTELGERFEQTHQVKPIFSFGSTGQLADQIEHGAPFDVFAAANIAFVDQLKEKGLILEDTQHLYALGRIGFATLKDHGIAVSSFSDLLDDDIVKIAIANPDHAPYGLAAKEALNTDGVWDKVEHKLVFGRNISEAMTLLETRNVEVAIIALSLLNDDLVNFTIIDEELHNPLEQAIAVIKRTNNESAAREFIDFIFTSEGTEIMNKYGFTLPEGPANE